MVSKIKNIIIFVAIGVSLVFIYIYFIKKAPEQPNLISNTTTTLPSNTTATSTNTTDQNSSITQNLLSVLLSVKNIKLDDRIFSDKAFLNLRDSSITLNPPTNVGRPNPFAPIGYDNVPVTPVIPVTTPVSNTTNPTGSAPTNSSSVANPNQNP